MTYVSKIVVVSLMFCGLILSLVIATPSGAQVAGATLSGTVTDQSGAVVSSGEVSIQNVETGVIRLVKVDSAGFFTAPNLLPGNYKVTVSAQGFSTEVRSGITLNVGDQQVLNLTLHVGPTAQKIQVTGEAPEVQLATSSINAVVNSTTIRELPLNGRSWTDLATLEPGVGAIHQQIAFTRSSNRGNRGFGAQLTISGARPQQNNYRLDGVSLNDFSNGGPGNVVGGNLGVDAIQEFSVVTTNASAEYGKTAGGVLNASTRSGTNDFHGSVYEFLRNSVFDARNYFDPAKIPPFKRNQFGASGGAPIRKNHTFIFADYEGVRQAKGVATTSVVPSAAARTGNLSTGQVPVDPAAAKYLGFYPVPLPQNVLSGGDLGIFSFSAQQVVNENFFTTRLDHRFSDKDSLFGTYMYDYAHYSSPDPLDIQLQGSRTGRHVLALEENHIFSSTFVNTVRIGYNREAVGNNESVSAINPLAVDKSLAAVPGQLPPVVRISGIQLSQGGLGTNEFFYYWNSIQGYDDAFVTHGTHSLKFGVAVERMDFNFLRVPGQNGQFNFSSLKNFLANKPSRFVADFPETITPRGLRQTVFGAYIQDDWRARPNLTLNLGLRYEMTTVPTEVHGKLSTLINITDATAHLGNPFFLNPTLHNFAPRIGFAWDPFGNGKSAVRSGFGIYDVLPLPYEYFTLTNISQPFASSGQISNPGQGTFPGKAFPLLLPASLTQAYIDHAPKRNYVMQWNLNLQRELPGALVVQAGYVGSRGVHQPFRVDDADIVMPRLTPLGYLFPVPAGSTPTLNPNFGTITSLFYRGDSSYHALEMGVRKRMSRGLQVQGSFTWGKSIDTNSAVIAGDQFANSISSWWNWFDTKVSRAVSDFNVSRTLAISAIWEVPRLKSASGPVGWITNGWELGGIYAANTGVPFTPTLGTDGDPLGLGSGDPWDFPNRIKGCNPINSNFKKNSRPFYINTDCFAVPTAPPSYFTPIASAPMCSSDPALGANAVGDPTLGQCLNLRGNAGRNSLTGPGLSNLDFTVYKTASIKRISETFRVQFRAEIFNVLNRANFLAPLSPFNTDIFDSAGNSLGPRNGGPAGLLTTTSTDSRQVQFGLKLIW